MTEPGAGLALALERCRRRLRLVQFVRYAVPAACAATVVWAVGAAALRPSVPAVTTAFAGLLGLAVLAAAGLAVRLTPSLRAAAMLIDRRLVLPDVVLTAVHVMDDDDAMARLVRQDAARRLSAIRPATVFPLEAPPRVRWLLLITATIPLLTLAAIRPAPGASTQDGLRAGGRAGVSASAAAAAMRSTPSAPASVVVEHAGAASVPASMPIERDAHAPLETPDGQLRGSADGRSATAGQSERRPESGPRTGRDAGASRDTSGGAGYDRRASADARLVPDARRVRDANSAAGAAANGTGADGRGGSTGRAGSTGLAIRGRTASAGAVADANAGRGAEAGASFTPDDTARHAPPRQPADLSALLETWRRGHAPIAMDHVPVDRRLLVQRYFSGIQSRGKQ